jgi:signal peptidase I
VRTPSHASRRRHPAAHAGLSALRAARAAAIVLVATLVVAWLTKALLVQVFGIPSGSMRETLVEGDRIVVSRLTPRFADVERGDVVVFHDPGGWLDRRAAASHGPLLDAGRRLLQGTGLLPEDDGEFLVKRVVGVGGDHVTCCDAEGYVQVDGVAVDESPYLRPGVAPSDYAFDVTVPVGTLFVLGDNRSDSSDSRVHADAPGGAFVPVDGVVGRVVAKVWPRLERVPDGGAVFAGVPPPAG